MTCLHLAAKGGNLDVLKYLLFTERLDINVKVGRLNEQVGCTRRTRPQIPARLAC